MIDTFDEKIITPIIQEILKYSEFTIIPVRNSGVSSNVFKIMRNGNSNLFLKIAHKLDTDFTVEQKITKLLQDKGVLLPKVLFAIKDDSRLNRSIIITEEIIGESISNSTTKEVISSIVNQIDIINSVTIKGFGEIEINEQNEIQGKFSNYYDYFVSNLARYPNEETKKQILSKFEKELERSKQINQGRLVHGDMGSSHILEYNNEFSGFIDFDDIKSSTKFYDLFELMHYKSNAHLLIAQEYISNYSFDDYLPIYKLEEIFFEIEEQFFLKETYENNPNPVTSEEIKVIDRHLNTLINSV